MTWTDDSLYMAWIVKTAGHWPIDLTKDYNKDGTADAAKDGKDLGYMYMFSCVQFMMSTGAPDATKKVYQTAEWSGNYLEVGLSIQKDGQSKKIAWSKPKGGENLAVDAWDFSGARNDAAKTTTYEVRIPWNKSGVKTVGNNVKFGLTYAIGDQEDFDKAPNMCEWQDGILDGKNMDAGAVVNLTGKPTDVKIEVSQVTGAASTSSAATSSKKATSSTASSKVTSSAASSKVTSSKAPASSSSVAASSEAPEENNNTLTIILIVAGVVVIGGVAAYLIISKKKKQ
jgi:hypothetical protein